MSTRAGPTGPIVVGVDGSPSDARAAWWAANEAACRRVPLVILHVRAGHRTVPGADGTLPAAAARAGSGHPGLTLSTRLVTGDPAEVLVTASHGAQLLVLGSHRPGSPRRALGSVHAAVLRQAQCPVAVVPSASAGTRRSGVVVGVDGTPGSRPVLEQAFRSAAAARLDLTVLHCLSPHRDGRPAGGPDLQEQAAHALLAELVAGLGEQEPDVRVSLRVVRRHPEDALRDVGDGMDLVVVGRAPGRHRGPDLAEHLLRHASTTVVVVPLAAPVPV